MAASAARTNALNAFAKIFAETSPRLQSACPPEHLVNEAAGDKIGCPGIRC
jgi:hypothetical protein